MWGVHQRLAELWSLSKQRSLTAEEMSEFRICLDANMNKCWEVATLKNQSLLAHITKDNDWQFEICSELEEVYADFH
ncbi:hypothetical protein ACINLE_17585 [Bacillus sp. z60-18]|uniref:DUF7667 family protein n=1 Tax=unclassified Bacillus (in: firmicutes) TaxID=185979 RepID=UPI00390C8339